MMTYACICGWSVWLANEAENKDVFLTHFHNNIKIHNIGLIEHEENSNED